MDICSREDKEKTQKAVRRRKKGTLSVFEIKKVKYVHGFDLYTMVYYKYK